MFDLADQLPQPNPQLPSTTPRHQTHYCCPQVSPRQPKQPSPPAHPFSPPSRASSARVATIPPLPGSPARVQIGARRTIGRLTGVMRRERGTRSTQMSTRGSRQADLCALVPFLEGSSGYGFEKSGRPQMDAMTLVPRRRVPRPRRFLLRWSWKGAKGTVSRGAQLPRGVARR